MIIFLTGATGFIGRHVARAVAGAGHEVVCGVHRAATTGSPGRVVAVDYVHDLDPSHWRPRLRDVDVVINAVGLLRERGAQTFDLVHSLAPRALFIASVEAGVTKIIQISALGADADAGSRYHLSKRAADEFLTTLPIDSAIVQPSLVYGAGGTSAGLFNMLASLPVIPVPGDGSQLLQPVHIEDLVAAVLALVERKVERGARYPIVGPTPLTLKEFLHRLRAVLGFPAARTVHVPIALVRLAATMGERIPGALLDSETLAMLARGNTAPVTTTHHLLGHSARPVEEFLARKGASSASLQAVLDWQLPLLRLAIAVVWIWTGIVSMGVFPLEESYALLARLGLHGMTATAMLYTAAVGDILVGVATLAMRNRRWLWTAQIAVILGYTLIISVWLPEFWLHPYGPMVKNLPLLVAIWLLATLERRRWTT